MEGPLIHMYADRLPAENEGWRSWCQAFKQNLSEAASQLQGAGLAPVLIKADIDQYSYGNFDVLVSDEEWETAVQTLRARGWRLSRWFPEPDKLLVFPPEGPFVHLHRAVSWFGVPVISAEGVRARSQSSEYFPLAVPAPVDNLRMWLAHAGFQNLAFDLSELLALRPLLVGDLLGQAREAARAEGWSRAFDLAKDAAVAGVRLLDQCERPGAQVRLPSTGSLKAGFEHAAHLWKVGRRALAVREIILRPALIARKATRSSRGC